MNDDKDFFNEETGSHERSKEDKFPEDANEDGGIEHIEDALKEEIKAEIEAEIEAEIINGDNSEHISDEHIEDALKEEIKAEIKAESNIPPSTDSIQFTDPNPDKAYEPPIAPPPPYYGGGYNNSNGYTQNPNIQNNYQNNNRNPNNQNSYNPNVYQVPPTQPYQQDNMWRQQPQQQQSPQQQQQQPPLQQEPSQKQTQWTFNDYGPMQQAPQNKQKPPKKPKKPHSSSFGIKVFAGIISAMFLLTAATFTGYVVYDMSKNTTSITEDIDSPSSKTESGTDKPSMQVGQTPDKSADKDNDGVLSGREINEKVSPSVVGVAVYAKTTGFQLAGQGSGIIMTKDGYVITNAHVVSDQTNQVKIEKVEVILSDGNTHDAKIIGMDIKTDLAVLKINADNLTPAEFGDSDKLRIGDDVFVIGNPSGVEFAGSFTKGTVSSLSRSIYMQQLGAEVEYIQTDAAINPGNSGGAFINEYGQVVGISSAKMRVEEGYEGMGFAIPINNAKDIVDSLLKNGYVAGRPKIGISYKEIGKTISDLNGIPHGLRVVIVEEDSDAFKQGVKAGDIIFKIGGKETHDAVTIAEALEGKKPGESISLSIYRVDDNGRSSTFEVSVVLGEMVS